MTAAHQISAAAVQLAASLASVAAAVGPDADRVGVTAAVCGDTLRVQCLRLDGVWRVTARYGYHYAQTRAAHLPTAAEAAIMDLADALEDAP